MTVRFKNKVVVIEELLERAAQDLDRRYYSEAISKLRMALVKASESEQRDRIKHLIDNALLKQSRRL